MTVADIMLTAELVFQCYPADTIETCMDVILANPEKGAVVVVDYQASLNGRNEPVGIVTKTDLLRAYKQKLDFTLPVETIMGTKIESILNTASIDKAAEHFGNTTHYHAFVLDKDNTWVGLLTVLDVTRERARAARSWPWNASGDGTTAPLDFFTKRAHHGHLAAHQHPPEQHVVAQKE